MNPAYYRKLPSNIAGVKTIENLLKDIYFLQLDKLEANLVTGKLDPADARLYKKYFEIHETPVRGTTYSFNEDAICQKKELWQLRAYVQ